MTYELNDIRHALRSALPEGASLPVHTEDRLALRVKAILSGGDSMAFACDRALREAGYPTCFDVAHKRDPERITSANNPYNNDPRDRARAGRTASWENLLWAARERRIKAKMAAFEKQLREDPTS